MSADTAGTAGTTHADALLERLEQEVIHALKIHFAWRELVRILLSPERSSVRIEPQTDCPLDAWLSRSLDHTFRGLPLYGRTVKAHDRFHRAIQALYDDPSIGQRPTAAAARTLKGCLEEWLTLSRERESTFTP